MAVVHIHVQTIPEKQTLEANDWRILKQKIESQLYSTAGDGTRSFED